MMVRYLGTNPGKAQHEIYDTKGFHARFSFLVDLYENHSTAYVDVDGDDARVGYHRACLLRSDLMVLIDMLILVGKSATNVDVIYLNMSLTWRGFMSTTRGLLVWCTSISN